MNIDNDEQTTIFDFGGVSFTVTARYFENAKSLHSAVIENNPDVVLESDAIAYADKDTIYLPRNSSTRIIVHEATHMGLTMLSETGVKTLDVTSGDASPDEELLGDLIGEVSDWLLTAQRQALRDEVMAAIGEQFAGEADVGDEVSETQATLNRVEHNITAAISTIFEGKGDNHGKEV